MSEQSTSARVFFQPLPEHDTLNVAYLLAKVSEHVVVNEHGCWVWQGHKTSRGYGRIDYGRKKHVLHRLVYALCVAEPARTHEICHDCPGGDNPSCCNPAHLFLGTHAENMQDSERKGRNSHSAQRGEDKPQAKLTEDGVRELRRRRAAGEGVRALAEEFQISPAAVSEAVRGKKWGHIQ